MALIAVASAKGSPGATTASLTLSAVWPRETLLAELDPSGSDLLYRLRDTDRSPLSADSGVLGLLNSEGVDGGSDPLAHAVSVGVGLDLLVGPPPARVGEIAGRWEELGRRLAAATALDVLADCGRLHPDLSSRSVLAAADAAVIVTRPTIDGVAHLLARTAEIVDLLPTGAPLFAVVVTDVRDSRSQREIDSLAERAELPIRVLGRLAYDPEAVGMLGGAWSSRLERSLLIRSARELASKLDRALTDYADEYAAEQGGSEPQAQPIPE